MKAVLISYAESDFSVAQALKVSLESAGVGTWLAPCEVVPGEQFRVRIVDAIAEAAVVVLVLSRASNSSRYVQSEIGLAYERGKVLLAFAIEDVEPSKALRMLLDGSQRLAAFEGSRDQAIAQLTKSVLVHLGTTKTLAPPESVETAWILDPDQQSWRNPGSDLILVRRPQEHKIVYDPEGDWWSRVSGVRPLRIWIDRYEGPRRTDSFEFACDEDRGLHIPLPAVNDRVPVVSRRAKDIGAIISSPKIPRDQYELYFRKSGIRLA